MNPTTARRPGKPARVFGQGILDDQPAPAWEAELRRQMGRMGYTEQARADAAEHARGSMTLDGCLSVDPSDLAVLNVLLADVRTDHNIEATDAPAVRTFQPTAADRAWAAATAPARFEASVVRNLFDDAADDALATLAHERGLLPPDRPVYMRPVRRRSRPVSDRDVRRSGAL